LLRGLVYVLDREGARGLVVSAELSDFVRFLALPHEDPISKELLWWDLSLQPLLALGNAADDKGVRANLLRGAVRLGDAKRLSALVAVEQPAWWWCDPVGAIVISVYIIRAWLLTALEQVEMVVGKEADPEFVERVQEISRNHSELMKLDTVRAYHFGPKFLVELEMVMDQNTPLHITHDTGIRLQHKIENIDEVERCFVHIDYSFREFDDHDPDVPLTYKVGDSPRLKLITPDGDAPMFANPAAGTAEAFKSIR
jgi:hypothetical protein